MHQSVDAFIKADKDAEIGDVFDFAFNHRPDGISLFDNATRDWAQAA